MTNLLNLETVFIFLFTIKMIKMNENIISTIGSVVSGVLMGPGTIRLVRKNGTFSKFKQIYEHARYKFSNEKMRDIVGFEVIGKYTLDDKDVHEAYESNKQSCGCGMISKFEKDIFQLNGKIKVLTTLLFEITDPYKEQLQKIQDKFACDKPVYQSPLPVVSPPTCDSVPLSLSKPDVKPAPAVGFKFDFTNQVKPAVASEFKFVFNDNSKNVDKRKKPPTKNEICYDKDFEILFDKLKKLYDKSTPDLKEKSSRSIFYEMVTHNRDTYKGDDINELFMVYCRQYSYMFPVAYLDELLVKYHKYLKDPIGMHKKNPTSNESIKMFLTMS